MKKHIIVVFTLLCLLLCSCNTTNSQDIPNNTDISKSDTSSQENASQPYISPLLYDSFDELKKSITEEHAEKIYAQYSKAEATRKQIDEIGFFVSKFQSQSNVVPCLNGEMIDFRNKEGFHNIALLLFERYNLSWISYYPYVSTGENFYIKTTYLPDSIVEKQKNPVASEVIKELSPNSPNINNLGDQHKNIYNQALNLRDCEVAALVIEYNEDNRNSVIFVYKDLLVEVRCDPEVWNEKWFSSLSFESLEE